MAQVGSMTLFKTLQLRSKTGRSYGGALVALTLVLMISSGSSWAFNQRDKALQDPSAFSTYYSLHTSPRSDIAQKSSSTVTDACLPLLKTIRHTPPAFATDRYQRTAGKAAVLGLMIGARFALSPAAKVQANDRKPVKDAVWHDIDTTQGDNGDHYALSIVAYRQCQKQIALKQVQGSYPAL